WPRPGPGSTIGRLVLAGFLLGPGLGIALGPWLARNRLPLYEAQAPWVGAAPILADWPHPPGPGEGAEARKAGERALLVAWDPTAAGAETLALELALPRLSRSPELSSARDGRRESWAAALRAGPAATLTRAGDCAARLRGWAEAWRAVAAGSSSAASGEAAEPVPSPGRWSPPPLAGDVPRLALAANPA